MSGKVRTRQPLRVEPFDLARVAAGEAMVLVTLPDGRGVVGTLYMEDMFVPDGDPVAVSATAEAAAKRATNHTLAMLLTGGLTAKGQTDRAIVAELMRQGYLKAGDPDDDDRLRSMKKWRARYRRTFPPA